MKSFFKNIRAACETLLFLRSGVERFSPTVKSAWLSMLIPVLLAPLTYISTQTAVPLGAEDVDKTVISTVMILRDLTAFGIFILFMYSLAGMIDEREGFPRMITASNWAGLVFTILCVPILYMHGAQMIDRQTLEDIFIWVLIYQYAVAGFIIWGAYTKLPWELAAALAIFLMFIGDVVHEGYFAAFDIPVVDYFEVY